MCVCVDHTCRVCGVSAGGSVIELMWWRVMTRSSLTEAPEWLQTDCCDWSSAALTHSHTVSMLAPQLTLSGLLVSLLSSHLMTLQTPPELSAFPVFGNRKPLGCRPALQLKTSDRWGRRMLSFVLQTSDSKLSETGSDDALKASHCYVSILKLITELCLRPPNKLSRLC